MEGWTWLSDSSKWHFFRGGMSLCRKWGWPGTADMISDSEIFENNKCKACARIRAKDLIVIEVLD